MKLLYGVLVIIFIITGCSEELKKSGYVDFVDPMIGTAKSATPRALRFPTSKENNSQVVPYVTAPFGMTNWTAQTVANEHKCSAPYYYKDSIINGFRGSHFLSGSCVQDYGSVTIMPVSGSLEFESKKRGSRYSHDREHSTPYNYSVYLEDHSIEVEMTATKRAGLFKFKYENEGDAHIVINPNSDEGQGYIRILPESNEIVGYNPVHRIYQGKGQSAGFSGYFIARFDRKIEIFGVYQGDKVKADLIEISDRENLGAYVSFKVESGETIEVRVGTSFTSIDQARNNLDGETASLSFDQTKEILRDSWEELLSKVKVEGKNEDDKVIFYTALYHSCLQPRTFNDLDGSYVSFGGGDKIVKSEERDYFVDFSMWDTYRASHPLFNLLMPNASADMISSLLLKAEQGGWLPIFPCWNSYTSAMIGDHATATIADGYLKGVIDLTDKQYGYMLQNAFKSPDTMKEYREGKGRRALKSYLKYGYVPLEDSVKISFHDNEQVSRTLEYAFDDFALYQVAVKRGDTANAELLKSRALNYKNVYSPKDSTVRGRYADGRFTEVYDKTLHQEYITEGTPYQYTWYVPHDIGGLIDLMGGDQGFIQNLDNFRTKEQYWHGNEPGHQIPFLYNYGGEPWKTQKWVSEIMKLEYSSDPGGISGNDDAGQMSAWYLFAAMGFYPVAPSVPEYVISGPHFDKLTVTMDSGKELIIVANGASEGKNYIHGLTVNGEKSDKNFLSHFDIMDGGELVFTMSSKPNKNWGTAAESRPSSMSLR